MIFSDTIIEENKIFLRNLITSTKDLALDQWSNASSSYPMFSCPYEISLGFNKQYYVRYTYKFTTTNQSPTWVQYYLQGGNSIISGARINNPVAGTEYTISGIGAIPLMAVTLTAGTIYNGNSGQINGVSSQVKNVMLYDVDDLYIILKQKGTISNLTELKTWCDNNLNYSPAYVNYDITSIINASIEKVAITKGNLLANNFIEGEGLDFYATSDAIRLHKYFDTNSALSVYNNKGGGTVTHARIDATTQNSPFYPSHQYILKITTNGVAAPGAGGFICSHTAAANRIVIERFVAKVPIGYTVTAAFNNQGTGASVTYLSSRTGTGDWQEYAILYKCGATSGSTNFSSGGHVYISGPDNTNVTWYVAYCISCIITDVEYLKNFSILRNVERIKEGNIFSRRFDNLNLLPNGNCEKQTSDFIANNLNWIYDTEDIVGEGKASLVQPVGKGTLYLSPFRINPSQRYKISYWIKCKQDMTNFLTGIVYFLEDMSWGELTIEKVHYVTNTYTKLAAPLNNGDMSVKVVNNANWVARNYSRLGFRSTGGKSYNDIGSCNGNGTAGIVKDISGTDTINLNVAYSGNTIPINTYIVESFSGGTYPYPILKSQLPTDNTWKYVEGYFGGNSMWDGRTSGSSQWQSIPFDARWAKIRLNLYVNDGTVPIKYCDIRVEPVKTGSLTRCEEKIQIIGGN